MSRSMDGWLPKRALCSQCAVNIRASAQWGEMPVYGDVDLFVRREVSILDPYLVQALLVLRRCHALPTLDWGITFLFKTIIWVPEIRKEFFYLLFSSTTIQKLWKIWPAQQNLKNTVLSETVLTERNALEPLKDTVVYPDLNHVSWYHLLCIW